MLLSKDQIIAILIKFSNHIPLTQEEIEILDTWCQESTDRKLFLEELQQDQTKTDHLKIMDMIPVDADWSSFLVKNKIVKGRNLFKIRKLIPWAAAILFLPLLYFIKTMVSLDDTNLKGNYSKTVKKQDVNPANNSAELILADGTRYILDENTKDKKISDIQVNLDGNVLKVQGLSKNSSSTIVWNTISVPKGAYYTIVLEDNTKIQLNANSKLIFPSEFEKSERKVKLEGEAFFEVAHQMERPFYVECKDIEIKVLGTQFNVNSYFDKVYTTLESGSVQLKSDNKVMIIKPGQYSVWNGRDFTAGEADLSKDLAWKKGEFFFRKDNIIDIAYELSRWYNLEVKFVGNIDLKKLYSGAISRKSSLSKVLEVLKFGSDFDFEIHDNILIIKQNVK